MTETRIDLHDRLAQQPFRTVPFDRAADRFRRDDADFRIRRVVELGND